MSLVRNGDFRHSMCLRPSVSMNDQLFVNV